MSTTEPAKPFVVGVAGAPGAGKTALAHALARAWSTRVLHYDKHQPLTKLPMAQVRAWFARGGDPNEIDHSEIVGDLRRETRPGAGARLIFETPFGRLHRDSGAYIDFLVWIDTPLDLALSRALLAISQSARAGSAPGVGFLDWQIQYLTNYPLVRDMYVSQRQRIAPAADLVLDGTASVESWAAGVEAALQAGRGRSNASS